MAMIQTREQLLIDLYAAWHMARRHKVTKHYVRVFDRRADENIQAICDALYYRDYHPEPSSCFIVDRPKKREVFAAQFADRVVHHLYYNKLHRLFERVFIEDSYSCIMGRGTHYGIERLKHHIQVESDNYRKKCYVMSLDIRGYFMHIDRHILLNIVKGILRRMATHRYEGNQTWGDLIDIDFYLWLSEQIVMIDPKTSCKVVGKPEDWNGLDKNKSLFHTPEGCGLPIGNLTSQLLSNVYLNEFDQYAKRILKCQHYGRYVDDSYIVSCDKQWLLSLVPQIDAFLQERLHLSLHRGKTQIHEIHQGVEFLGGFIKPHRTYMSHAALRRLRKSISRLPMRNRQKVYRSVNAMLGVTSHFDSYKLRRELFYNERFLKIGYFDRDITMFFLK
jgi:retron-type reverse transcriptase